MLSKTQLRKSIKRQFASLPAERLQEQAEAALQKLARHPRFRQAKTVLLYYSLPDELPTHDFIKQWAAQKNILLPVVNDADLLLRRYTAESEICTGAFQIGEPQGETFTRLSEIDLVIVPGRAFDRAGHRLGRGKGYYDRFLSLPALSRTYRLGLCYPFQILEQIPSEPHDILMHEVLA